WTQFQMQAGQVASATPVTITATLNGKSASGSLTVAPTALKSLSISRSEEHTSELQSRFDLVCRLLLEKKKNTNHSARRKSNNLRDHVKSTVAIIIHVREQLLYGAELVA